MFLCFLLFLQLFSFLPSFLNQCLHTIKLCRLPWMCSFTPFLNMLNRSIIVTTVTTADIFTAILLSGTWSGSIIFGAGSFLATNQGSMAGIRHLNSRGFYTILTRCNSVFICVFHRVSQGTGTLLSGSGRNSSTAHIGVLGFKLVFLSLLLLLLLCLLISATILICIC